RRGAGRVPRRGAAGAAARRPPGGPRRRGRAHRGGPGPAWPVQPGGRRARPQRPRGARGERHQPGRDGPRGPARRVQLRAVDRVGEGRGRSREGAVGSARPAGPAGRAGPHVRQPPEEPRRVDPAPHPHRQRRLPGSHGDRGARAGLDRRALPDHPGAGRPRPRHRVGEGPDPRRPRRRRLLRAGPRRREGRRPRGPRRDRAGPAPRARRLSRTGPIDGYGRVMADRLPATHADLLRWSEALAAIARTGLGFTENLYERERFEEVLHIAADIRAAARADEDLDVEDYVDEWMRSVGKGVAGYVTPKTAVGAVVHDGDGRILLVQ